MPQFFQTFVIGFGSPLRGVGGGGEAVAGPGRERGNGTVGREWVGGWYSIGKKQVGYSPHPQSMNWENKK